MEGSSRLQLGWHDDGSSSKQLTGWHQCCLASELHGSLTVILVQKTQLMNTTSSVSQCWLVVVGGGWYSDSKGCMLWRTVWSIDGSIICGYTVLLLKGKFVLSLMCILLCSSPPACTVFCVCRMSHYVKYCWWQLACLICISPWNVFVFVCTV